ncbi:hypothetical protein D3C87_1115200 [compost metagenome]|uniref:Uncharacterized protein n=1 Tax=Variovorax boronicumulans TaxID=436515 RepID=A0AAW8DRS1_9BURK|nr:MULTISPECIES: hypothetical protein [Variovorax]MDP9876880.1 hypothetical protein [Variovorax boronicumulans]MDP9914115.1 hypothetical protein [Variovorax boronicumulans]MDP9918868.1 hypothetical protein [Variovorax boronicumulans]MDP9922243.1 hypothetical protein [Variovorax boronicumulans]PBI86161.1 hypothetical protein BKP43_44410 [Variovorax boronicumulans]
MEISALFDSLMGTWGDDILIWAVAAVTACIGLIAVVNVLDIFIGSGNSNEAG